MEYSRRVCETCAVILLAVCGLTNAWVIIRGPSSTLRRTHQILRRAGLLHETLNQPSQSHEQGNLEGDLSDQFPRRQVLKELVVVTSGIAFASSTASALDSSTTTATAAETADPLAQFGAALSVSSSPSTMAAFPSSASAPSFSSAAAAAAAAGSSPGTALPASTSTMKSGSELNQILQGMQQKRLIDPRTHG